MALWGMGSVLRLGDRTDRGRLSDRVRFLALDLLHQRTARGWSRCSERSRSCPRRSAIRAGGSTGSGSSTLALGVGALQMMLDRGQRLDWFESEEIVVLACLAGLGLYLFVAHTITTRDPFLDPQLITHRKFFVSLLLISIYGFLTMPPMVLMPAFLEHLRGYNVDAVGLLQSPRGVGMLSRDADQRPHHRQARPASAHRDRAAMPCRHQLRNVDLDRRGRRVADRLDRVPAGHRRRHHAGPDPDHRLPVSGAAACAPRRRRCSTWCAACSAASGSRSR